MKVAIAELAEPHYRPETKTKKRLVERYSGITRDWRLNEVRQELSYVTDDLQGDHYHANYLECLEVAWANHYGVVMTPDIMWHTLLSEVVTIVAKNPKSYAHLFTEVPEQKQQIIVPSGSLVVIPLDILVDAIKPLVPINSDIFMPEFSTTTDRARMARYASFADLVSPYYEYSMYLCGIPYVDVQGTENDWQKVLDSWETVSLLFPGSKDYFKKTTSILQRLIAEKDKPEFWRDMFRLEECGSGHQTEAFGWFTELYHNQPRVRYTQNFSSHLAKVCYKQLNTDMDYEMYHGVLCSTLEGDCLVPDFGSMIYHRPKVLKVMPLKTFQVESQEIFAK